jgi:hypothetical protein
MPFVSPLNYSIMLTFSCFRLVERTNPTTGEIINKIVVLGSDGQEYTYISDLSRDEIRNRRDELLANCKLIDTSYGKVAVSNRSKVLEEF